MVRTCSSGHDWCWFDLFRDRGLFEGRRWRGCRRGFESQGHECVGPPCAHDGPERLHPIDGSVAAAALQKPEAVPSDAELLKHVSGMKRGTVRSGHRRPMGVQFTLRVMTTKSLYAIKGHPDVSRMLRNQGKSVWMATKTTKGGNPVRVGFLSGTAHPEFTDRDSLALALKDLGVTDVGEKSNENAKAKLIRGPVSASYANVKVEGDAIVVLADDSVKDTVTDQLMDITSKMNAEDENVPGYQPARNIFFTPFRMGDEFCAEVIRKNNKTNVEAGAIPIYDVKSMAAKINIPNKVTDAAKENNDGEMVDDTSVALGSTTMTIGDWILNHKDEKGEAVFYAVQRRNGNANAWNLMYKSKDKREAARSFAEKFNEVVQVAVPPDQLDEAFPNGSDLTKVGISPKYGGTGGKDAMTDSMKKYLRAMKMDNPQESGAAPRAILPTEDDVVKRSRSKRKSYCLMERSISQRTQTTISS